MGVFDTVKTDMNCPNCNAKVEWQTKEAVDMNDEFRGEGLDTLNLKDIQVGEIHTYCSNCKKYYEYKVKNGKIITLLKEE